MSQLLVMTSKQPAGRLCFFSPLNDTNDLPLQQDWLEFDIRSVSTSPPKKCLACMLCTARDEPSVQLCDAAGH